MSVRIRRTPAVLALALGLLTGWGAVTASDWWGPCAPRFPGVDHLVNSLPTFACFTVGERTAEGYRLDVSYSGQEHDVTESLGLARDEAGVFWKQFPYPVSGIHIDTTAAFGESAVKEVTLTSAELRERFGPQPAGLGEHLPDQPIGRTEIALWSVSGLSLALAAGTLIRR